MARIKPGRPAHKGAIPDPGPHKEPNHLRFSFRHLDMTRKPKFTLAERSSQYFCKVFERLQAMSGFQASEFLRSRSSAVRCHPIDWKDTTEPNGFEHLNQQLRDLTPYQFEISANAHGRVHGFILGDTFYVVWFDPDHSLYDA